MGMLIYTLFLTGVSVSRACLLPRARSRAVGHLGVLSRTPPFSLLYVFVCLFRVTLSRFVSVLQIFLFLFVVVLKIPVFVLLYCIMRRL